MDNGLVSVPVMPNADIDDLGGFYAKLFVGAMDSNSESDRMSLLQGLWVSIDDTPEYARPALVAAVAVGLSDYPSDVRLFAEELQRWAKSKEIKATRTSV
ncbi:hypothetical protein SAMN04515617_1551 [Collimonas sp. OK242]|jgi:hypothetical protein|uniref:hypothetical protein n=1 Tax=Collimonas sp. OK242 TaxID=1798195 RepID=UPI000896AE87|nr:hypothetical protein [Collimonas sp. OK242]SDZ00233.1 hypothetical protein SAMN04515617_1551 [Collimonas sp. OK242]